MSKIICYVAFICLSIVSRAQAVCELGGGQVIVYFNEAGTVRHKDSLGAGALDTVWVYGTGFPAPCFVSGIAYSVDYGPNLEFLADVPIPESVSIGQSPTGIGIAFRFPFPRTPKFLIQRVLVRWRNCLAENADGPTVLPDPASSDPCVIYGCVPSHVAEYAEGARSQTCRNVELDIKPGACPNTFSKRFWKDIGSDQTLKGGRLKVAVLGSETVDVNDIDPSSILLEGVAPLPLLTTRIDVDTKRRGNNCVCLRSPHSDDDDDDDSHGVESWGFDGKKRHGDGHDDLLLYFRKADVAVTIGPEAPSPGTKITLTLTGTYSDGMPFEASDCIVIKYEIDDDDDDEHERIDAVDAVASMGFPIPNPFNPATRITYTVYATGHIRLAVYDVGGQLVKELVNEIRGPGEYVVEWEAGDFPSGVYFYRLHAQGRTTVRRATLLK